MEQPQYFQEIRPARGLYIKLGGGGEWEEDCMSESILRLGYQEADHDLCMQGFWDAIYQQLLDLGTKDKGAATRHVKQIKEFYTAPNDVLWITFHADWLWWCFSAPDITLLPDYSKTRVAIGGWNKIDIFGRPLEMSRLKGSLVSMQGFRGTICRVDQPEFVYLVNKINGRNPPELERTQEALNTLYREVEAIIHNLTWGDFEILVDLIFRQAGWQRLSRLGGTQKTIDLKLYSPITREKYAVQVKSTADKAVFEDYRNQSHAMEAGFARFYFVVHEPSHNLVKDLESDSYFKLIMPSDLARWVVEYGLTEWVISKAG